MVTLLEAANTKPKTDEQIYDWVKFFLGFSLQRTCRCTVPSGMSDKEAQELGLPHSSQLAYIKSCLWMEHSNSLFTGARGCGKTFCIAISGILQCLFYPKVYVLQTSFTDGMVSATKEKVIEMLEHFSKVLGEKTWILKDNNITFNNGSCMEFRTGGGKANIASRHPNILFIDECDKFSSGSIATLEFSVVDDGIGFQINLVSTSYSMADDSIVMEKIAEYTDDTYDKPAGMKPKRIYRICVLDIIERCDPKLYQCHNPVTKKNCALWDFCKGKARDGEGYYKIANILSHIGGEAGKRAFDSEMLLQHPKEKDAYFDSFSTKCIVNPVNKLDPTRLTFLGWDFGGVRCPHTCIVVQKNVNTGEYFVIDEFGGMGLLENVITQLVIKYPDIAKNSISYIDNAASTTAQIKGAKSYKDILREHGFSTKSTGVKGQRDQGFEMIEKLIDPADGENRLWINYTCKNLIREIYKAKVDSHGRAKDEGKDDYLDAARYVIWHTWRKRGGEKLVKRFIF